jgi:hypothetical protein
LAINTQQREYKVEAKREDAKQRELHEREERWERIGKLCINEMRNRRRLAKRQKSFPAEKPRRWYESDPKADEHVLVEIIYPRGRSRRRLETVSFRVIIQSTS